ncbi:MAG: DUF1697 domain-containing protein [Lactobacillus sp.]|jgi:uncharacterized protein (DUF1697 family)|nr:DUF1697 domain-containing protein [Lactobacillus sp.]MCI2033708.1 DUF1697 domain-containing protein [Lactobacillus sp.]
MDHVLLLRGVNVGGKHRVVMAELRAHLSAAGATQVVSYINSGNVLFAAPAATAQALVATVLQRHYDFPIAFTLLPAPAYLAAVAAAPTWWGQAEGERHNALFTLPGFQPEYRDLIRQKATPYDRIAFTEHVLFWSSPAKQNFSQALYAKMLPEPYYPLVSIRNRNTTLKLASLLQQRAASTL